MTRDAVRAEGIMALWAKERSATEVGYHPLIYHLIDVAAVTECLWSRVITRGYRARMSAELELAEEATGRWISFIAGLHDIGKASVVFALQLESAAARLSSLGLTGGEAPPPTPHAQISARLLPDLLEECGFRVPRGHLERLATALGGHHGRFPSTDTVRWTADGAVGQAKAWQSVRRELVHRVANALEVRTAPVTATISNHALMWLSGLISVADWIGSNTDFFRFACPNPMSALAYDPSYIDRSRDLAQEALERLGWLHLGGHVALEFEAMFPAIAEPNPLQEQSVVLASSLVGPGLVIMEAPMGQGKTEAALYLADRWSQAIDARGFYVALPTQATSNQMFERVRAFLSHVNPGGMTELQLLHGHASLSAMFQTLVRNKEPDFEAELVSVDGMENGGEVVASEWFTYRKRGLLAPFGVGTVDQALLTALQSNHVFVRLFGLAGKVVIIDEVHAYDAYMTTLLTRLLQWLAALGTSVVMLSATLPTGRRRQFCEAYMGASEAGDPSPYPRLTASLPGRTWQVPIPTHRVPPPVALDWIVDVAPGEPDNEGLIALLGAELADGGCAAVICNTVARAQTVYSTLRPHFGGLASDGLPTLDLFHARYPYVHRLEREIRCLSRFGKPGGTVTDERGSEIQVMRPRRAILVATQVIEQSLDLDFDLMISDLAPVDLLLQRLGRLHRHGRERPKRLSNPRMLVRGVYVDANRCPHFDHGSQRVYQPYVLIRTWQELWERARIEIPADIQCLIDAIYDDQMPPQSKCEALNQVLIKSWKGMQEALRSEETEAKQRYIKRPQFGGPLAEIVSEPRLEDDPRPLPPALLAMTRLAQPSVTVIVLWNRGNAPVTSKGRHVDLDAKPPMRAAQALLQWSVTLSDRRIVCDLLATKPPPGWRKSPLLRECRLLLLDAEDYADVDGTPVRLDSELGVVVGP